MATKIYHFSYDYVKVNESKMKSMLLTVDSILDVRSSLAGTFFVKSSASARELSKSIIPLIPGIRFIISEIGDNRQGWLPISVWDFIKQRP